MSDENETAGTPLEGLADAGEAAKQGVLNVGKQYSGNGKTSQLSAATQQSVAAAQAAATAKTSRGDTLVAVQGGKQGGTPPAAQAPSNPVRFNSMGVAVSNVLYGMSTVEEFVQAGDFIGMEPVYCEWAQMAYVRFTGHAGNAPPEDELPDLPSLTDDGDVGDEEGDTECTDAPQATPNYMPLDEGICISMRGNTRKKCVTPNAKGDLKEALFPLREFADQALAFETEIDPKHPDAHKYQMRRVNTVKGLCDQYCDVGTAEDAEWWANWFLDEWGAVAPTAEEQELVRQLTVRMGCNVLDRIYNPGRGLKSWPSIFGGPSLGKSEFVQHLLPPSMSSAGLHSRTLELSKKPDELVRKIAGKLLVEISELASIRAADIDHVKSLLSGGEKEARILFRNKERKFKMTCAYIGTANVEDAALPPEDLGLLVRLPVIEVTTSPWGRVDADGNAMDVADILNENDEAMRRRIWGAWKHWYFVKKFDPMRAFTKAEEVLIRKRAAPHSYQDAGTNENLLAAAELLHAEAAETSMGDNAAKMFSEGLLSVDINRLLDMKSFNARGNNSARKTGIALGKDPDWFEASTHRRSIRWACRSVCDAFPHLIVPGGRTEAAYNALAAQTATQGAQAAPVPMPASGDDGEADGLPDLPSAMGAAVAEADNDDLNF